MKRREKVIYCLACCGCGASWLVPARKPRLHPIFSLFVFRRHFLEKICWTKASRADIKEWRRACWKRAKAKWRGSILPPHSWTLPQTLCSAPPQLPSPPDLLQDVRISWVSGATCAPSQRTSRDKKRGQCFSRCNYWDDVCCDHNTQRMATINDRKGANKTLKHCHHSQFNFSCAFKPFLHHPEMVRHHIIMSI